MPPLFNGPEVLSSLYLLPVFLARTNLKLHNFSVTPKMVKKFIMNLDSSKASGPDCITVAVLNNSELELFYRLAELSISWEVS